MDITVRVVAPHFVAGLVFRQRVVVEAAPILAYMRGWDADRVRRYVDARGWSAARVGPHVASGEGNATGSSTAPVPGS